VRAVRGTEIAVLFREQANGEVRGSLRSNGGVNVARLAEQFGGGGHHQAAGFTVPGPLDSAVSRVVAAAEAVLAAQPAVAST
jgi:bifunctional oligoribonuclease and PAP phosphatase NrnA